MATMATASVNPAPPLVRYCQFGVSPVNHSDTCDTSPHLGGISLQSSRNLFPAAGHCLADRIFLLDKTQFCRTVLYDIIVIMVIFVGQLSDRIRYFVSQNEILLVLTDRPALRQTKKQSNIKQCINPSVHADTGQVCEVYQSFH